MIYLIAFLSAVQYVPYFLAIARKRIKPSVSGWSCFALSLAVTIAASVQTGSYSILISTGLSLLCQIAIIVAGLFMGIAHKPDRTEQWIICVVLGSVVVWLLAGSPEAAILINLGVDVVGTALILKKLYRMPFTESSPTWVIGTLGSGLAVWHFSAVLDINFVYLLTIFLSNLSVLCLIVFQRGRTRGPNAIP